MSTSPTRTFTRASMTTKITSVRDGRHSFRHFCHLPFVVLFWCEWSRTVFNHVYSTLFWLLFGSRPTSHVTLFVCIVAKKDLAETILVVIISSWLRWQKRSKTERILAVLRVLVLCQLYLVKVEDLIVNKIPREWVLLEDFNNPNGEWL